MKTTLEMAREAGFTSGELAFMQDNFLFFANLVRADERDSWPAEMEAMERQVNILTDALAKEREACAKVCDDLAAPERMSLDNEALYKCATLDCADAIRARSET